MHDPLVVAHQIIRPWPQRSSLPAAGRGENVRWKIRHKHTCGEFCRSAEDLAEARTRRGYPNRAQRRSGLPCGGRYAFPWYKPGSYARFWRLAGRDWYWPPLVTIWHREPGGRDSLTVCQRRIRDPAGTIHLTRGWRWHVHHWRIQVPPVQEARRWLFTRCEWCGGKHRKGTTSRTRPTGCCSPFRTGRG